MVTLEGFAANSALGPVEMERRGDEVAALLKTLSDPVRLMLACTLAEGEYSVGALEQRLVIRQLNLSQQLGVLREASIVATRRDAKQILYRPTKEKAARVIHALNDIFCIPERRT